MFLASPQGSQSGIKWRGYKSGTFSNVQSESFFVLNNEAEWQTYWKDQLGEKPQTAPRDVKWGQEMLVAVHLGKKATAGYSVFVKQLDRPTANVIRLTFVEKSPSPGSVNPQVITSPYEIIRLDRVGGTFEFKKEVATAPGRSLSLKWSVYQSETNSNLTKDQTLVIKDQASFTAYWRQHDSSAAVPTDVDWANEMLVAIHLGKCSSSGYDVIVTGIDPGNENDLVVSYIERHPAKQQRVVPFQTSPYSVIRVPRFTGTVRFNRRVWDNSG